ncbi:MAG: D-alanine--D-alanine ligase [Patescibacteria group bacterium]|nr:D-alanine--D-alanine ligase [Patescibacteria group bacterium]MDE1943904.1 D-alanine--D-alanine ligase [Patescibacteria group bacterium]MDE1945267.1 D-alanine--D-alanine ligase [Patescibacteria group bacterium]MDE2057411.1 D-alanine--D-alanine ligase [Patescibacteria group bacterium]
MQTVVGVLRGGPSKEHEISLQSGAAMLAHLSPEKYHVRDIYIDKAGVWHAEGKATSPDRVLRQMDVALLPLHGEYGESGEVQRLLERFGVRYAGPDAFATVQAQHKAIGKALAEQEGLKTPASRLIADVAEVEASAAEVVRAFHQPVVVKPAAWGSSVGVSIVGGYAPVLAAAKRLFDEGAASVLIEEFVRGREATVGVVEGLRGEQFYALPPVEIVPPEGDFFSYASKYNGASREICPGRFSRVETEELLRAAKVMHRALGQRYYSRSDFIAAPSGIYYLETNSAPAVGLTTESLLPKALKAVGISFAEFLDHLVAAALAV